MLVLGLLGACRSGKGGKIVVVLMILLFGYVLVATYWVKLIPLCSGFDGRTSVASLMMLYGQRLPALIAGLNQVSLAPAATIILMSGLVSILAVALQIILIRLILIGHSPRASSNPIRRVSQYCP
jgi:hypothetical protein